MIINFPTRYIFSCIISFQKLRIFQLSFAKLFWFCISWLVLCKILLVCYCCATCRQNCLVFRFNVRGCTTMTTVTYVMSKTQLKTNSIVLPIGGNICLYCKVGLFCLEAWLIHILCLSVCISVCLFLYLINI